MSHKPQSVGIDPRRLLSLLLMFVGMLAFTGCGKKHSSGSYSGPAGNWTGEVEVAPAQWLALDGEVGRAWFRCRWNGKSVYWPGDYRRAESGDYDGQIPVTLRSWENRLYLIYDEFVVPDGRKFGYAVTDPSGTRFEIIPKRDFPRQIATQNIGADREGILHDEKGVEVDRLEIFRKLDIASPYLRNSTTSKIWYDLEKGSGQQEMRDSPEENTAFYAEYVKRYRPIPLPGLIR